MLELTVRSNIIWSLPESWWGRGGEGEERVKNTHSITRCGTFNCAVYIGLKDMFHLRDKMCLLFLVLFWFFVP